MSALNHLEDYRVVKVVLPLLENKQKALDAVAKINSEPFFEVTFLPSQLQLEQVDLDGLCQVTFDVVGESQSIKAEIASTPGEAKLLLKMVDAFVHVQKREYFRVDATLSVNYWLADSEQQETISIQTQVNISGGGLRFPISEPIVDGTKLGLELVINAPQSMLIECLGQVVGTYDVAGEKQLAMTFVDIKDEDRDAIIAYCLAAQRKQLRLKVRVLGKQGTV